MIYWVKKIGLGILFSTSAYLFCSFVGLNFDPTAWNVFTGLEAGSGLTRFLAAAFVILIGGFGSAGVFIAKKEEFQKK